MLSTRSLSICSTDNRFNGKYVFTFIMELNGICVYTFIMHTAYLALVNASFSSLCLVFTRLEFLAPAGT